MIIHQDGDGNGDDTGSDDGDGNGDDTGSDDGDGDGDDTGSDDGDVDGDDTGSDDGDVVFPFGDMNQIIIRGRKHFRRYQHWLCR